MNNLDKIIWQWDLAKSAYNKKKKHIEVIVKSQGKHTNKDSIDWGHK